MEGVPQQAVIKRKCKHVGIARKTVSNPCGCCLPKQSSILKWRSLAKFFMLLLLVYLLYVGTYFVLYPSISQAHISEQTSYRNGVDDKRDFVDNSQLPDSLLNKQIANGKSLASADGHPLCGGPMNCRNDEFPVRIYTGKNKDDEPYLCVDGKYVIGKDLNNGGRGINVAVVDNITKKVVRINRFDTYETDSTGLETLLLTLRQGDIIILFTFDEASKKLTRISHLLLYEIGSALIQNLQFRSSWYLVGQKGIKGFSPFEELHFSENSGWAKVHDVHICVPLKIPGQLIHPDPLVRDNKERINFCNNYPHFIHFCDSNVVNDPTLPSTFFLQKNEKRAPKPLIIMSGSEPHFLALTLETVVRQIRISQYDIVLFYLASRQDVIELSKLFHIKSVAFSEAIEYCDRIQEAINTTTKLFPSAKEIIVIEENAILAPDFLPYMEHLSLLLSSDQSIHAVSAWNDNGYKPSSSNSSSIYRVHGDLTGYAFMVRNHIQSVDWCHKRKAEYSNSTDNNYNVNADIIIPDMSRVLYMHSTKASETDNLESALFYNDRVTSLTDKAIFENVESFIESQYATHLIRLLGNSTAITLNVSTLDDCSFSKHKINATRSFTIYYEQNSPQDWTILKKICACFGLFHHPNFPPRGLYYGLLRFSYFGRPAMIVGSKSPFYKHRSKNVGVVSENLSIDR